MSDFEEQKQAPEAVTPSIGIDDIKNAVRIIDFASTQGAFKGWEVIEQVLIVRNRLNNFTKAIAPDVAPDAAPEVSEPANAEVTTDV